MFVSVVIVAMRGAAPQEAGVISGLTSTMQQVGGAVGLAALISVATSGHGDHASLDPRAGFVVLGAVMLATALTAAAMAVRSHRAPRPVAVPPQTAEVAAARLDHTIVHASDPEASAAFYADLLGLTRAEAATPFVEMADAYGVRLAFARHSGAPAPMHYAFRGDRGRLEQVLARLDALGLDHWADPHTTQRGRTYLENDLVGAYWHDPDHHLLELIAPA
jgi:catechol 2,3-dioxygenase-like lactoylglutathione lyase family enzyme